MIKNLTNILSKKKKSSLNILFICSMMVNFMCQLGLAMVPRYLVKHSECFHDDSFWLKKNIEIGEL